MRVFKLFEIWLHDICALGSCCNRFGLANELAELATQVKVAARGLALAIVVDATVAACMCWLPVL